MVVTKVAYSAATKDLSSAVRSAGYLVDYSAVWLVYQMAELKVA